MPPPAYDVFISHASEDKDTFVRPLAVALNALGVTVWYDEFSLRPGDSISRSIDKGRVSPYGRRKRSRTRSTGTTAGEPVSTRRANSPRSIFARLLPICFQKCRRARPKEPNPLSLWGAHGDSNPGPAD